MSEAKKSPEELAAEEKSVREQRVKGFIEEYETLCQKHGLRLIPRVGNVDIQFAVEPYQAKQAAQSGLEVPAGTDAAAAPTAPVAGKGGTA